MLEPSIIRRRSGLVAVPVRETSLVWGTASNNVPTCTTVLTPHSWANSAMVREKVRQRRLGSTPKKNIIPLVWSEPTE